MPGEAERLLRLATEALCLGRQEDAERYFAQAEAHGASQEDIDAARVAAYHRLDGDRLTRRRLLKILGTGAGGLALFGLSPVTAFASVAPQTSRLPTVPVELQTDAQLKAYLAALEDPQIRRSLSKQSATLPPPAAQFLRMLDDPTFLAQGRTLTSLTYQWLNSGSKAPSQELRQAATAFASYMETSYPAAWATITTLAQKNTSRAIALPADAPWTATNVYVGVEANVVVVVNGFAYANVAFYTLLAIAAGAVAVAAITVA